MKPEEFYGWGMELMDNLPRYWEEDDFMQQWLMSLGFEFEVLDRLTAFLTDEDAVRAMANNLPNDPEPLMAQWFVRTANDRGIELWEEMLDIPHDNSLTRADRVAGITTRLYSAQTPTPEYIRQQLLQYVEDLEILEPFHLPGNDINRYTFEIRIIKPTGILDNVKENIELMVERIKPAHLGFMIVWSELTWAGLGDMTWADLGDMTWRNLTV
jgi:hypothetical protein